MLNRFTRRYLLCFLAINGYLKFGQGMHRIIIESIFERTVKGLRRDENLALKKVVFGSEGDGCDGMA